MPSRNREEGIVSLSKGVGESRWQIKCELNDEELRAIGLITVQWAHLEHCLLVRTRLLAEEMGVPAPKNAVNPSFAKRLRAFRDLVSEFTQDQAAKESLLSLTDQIANAEDQRHKIAHAMWDWDDLDNTKLTAYSFREPFVYERPLELSKLEQLGKRISELLVDLTFPDGVSILDVVPIGSRFIKPPWAK